MVSTDGRTDRRTDTEGYNIIPCHTLVAGYKNTDLPNAAAVQKLRLILRLAGNIGISDHWGKPKPFSNNCLVTENKKA